MTKSRERLADQAMKKRAKTISKWRKKALRIAKRELKRQARKGETFVCVWIELNKVDRLLLPWAWEGVKEAAPVLKSMGFVVINLEVHNIRRDMCRIDIDLLQKPIAKPKEEVK